MKIGIVGAGGIVQVCLEALEKISTVKSTAICGLESEKDKLQALSSKYHIDRTFTDYNQFLKYDNIDIVYIGILNIYHYEYAKQALLAGKSVICEKPFTVTSKQAMDLKNIALKNNLFLFEAITLLYNPNFHYIREQVTNIGDIKIIQCNFSQYSSRYTAYRNKKVLPALDPTFAGGALYDINIYNIHFILSLFGKPLNGIYYPNKGFNGIDTSGIVIANYENFSAVSVGAKDSSSPNTALIQGENGYIQLHGATNSCPKVELCINDEISIHNHNMYDNHMVYEFLSFYEMFLHKDYNKCYEYLEHTITVMEFIENIRLKANINFK